MAFSLKITAARATSVQIQAEGASGYTLLVSYRLCVGGPGSVGGNPGAGSGSGASKDKGAAAYEDVVIGTGERTMTQVLAAGRPLPVPAELATLVRGDCRAVYGGQPDAVLIGGVPYS